MNLSAVRPQTLKFRPQLYSVGAYGQTSGRDRPVKDPVRFKMAQTSEVSFCQLFRARLFLRPFSGMRPIQTAPLGRTIVPDVLQGPKRE